MLRVHLSMGFELKSFLELFESTPASLNALLNQTLHNIGQSKINRVSEQRKINFLVNCGIQTNAESSVGPFNEGPMSACEELWESEHADCGYLCVSISSLQSDHRKVAVNSKLAEIFGVDKGTLLRMFHSDATKLPFAPVEFLCLVVHDIENMEEDETLRYIRIIPPAAGARLVRIHSRKSYNMVGELHKVHA